MRRPGGVNRADFVAALAGATAAPTAAGTGLAAAPVSAEIGLRVDAPELLAPFAVTIAVRNPTATNVALDFPSADIYRIDVRKDGETVWSTATGHKPLLIARRIVIAPGTTRLASQIIDGVSDDRRAYEPGRYIVRVEMLGTTLRTTVDKPVTFVAPIAIAAARKSAQRSLVTIAGIPTVDAGVFTLRDASGMIRLSRPLGLGPTGTYIVRGAVTTLGDDIEIAVDRSAPAFDNRPHLTPTAAPTL